jgi:hypothetical protein
VVEGWVKKRLVVKGGQPAEAQARGKTQPELKPECVQV